MAIKLTAYCIYLLYFWATPARSETTFFFISSLFQWIWFSGKCPVLFFFSSKMQFVSSSFKSCDAIPKADFFAELHSSPPISACACYLSWWQKLLIFSFSSAGTYFELAGLQLTTNPFVTSNIWGLTSCASKVSWINLWEFLNVLECYQPLSAYWCYIPIWR